MARSAQPPQVQSNGSLRHLLSVSDLTDQHLHFLFERSDQHLATNRQKIKKQDALKGRTLINLFYENSTRTRTSFELAGKRLGMDVINISASHSSVQKGETLIDTAMTLDAMQADIIVIRHPMSGALHLLKDRVRASLVNAGDGLREHPTQALLDASTIRRIKGKIDGLRIAIIGDIAHSRVARSNAQLLTKLGASVVICAPPVLMPSHAAEALGVETSHDMVKSLKDADVVMMLRVQQERIGGKSMASVREYFQYYGLDRAKLAHASADALVLHPGPINRGVEIDGEIADAIGRSAILDQVETGVAMRQAVLELMLKEEN